MIMRPLLPFSYIIRRDRRRVLNHRAQHEVPDINIPIGPHFVLPNKDHWEQKDPTDGSVAPMELQPIKCVQNTRTKFFSMPIRISIFK